MKIKIPVYRFILLCLISSLTSNTSWSQKKDSKLIGDWIFTKIDILHSYKDSMESSKEWEGVIISLGQGGKFVTKKKKGYKNIIVATGKYNISNDNKYLYQDDTQSEIILLNDKELVLKMEMNVILHFKRFNIAKQ